MAMMLADDSGGRRRKRLWRLEYITDQFHTAVSSLKTRHLPCWSRNSLLLWKPKFLTAALYPKPVEFTMRHPTVRWRFSAVFFFSSSSSSSFFFFFFFFFGPVS
jgi:hypothetical protein